MEIIVAILSFFAVYGAIQLLARAILDDKLKNREDMVFSHRLLAVKDCEDSIEGLVRNLFWEDIREPLIVLDLGSTDRTDEILGKLEKDYDFLQKMKPEEYQVYLQDMTKE